MNTKKVRSVRKKQRLLVGSVLVLTLLIIVNVIVSAVLQSAEKQYGRVLRIQKTFVDMLSLEQQVLNGTTHYANLLVAGQDIGSELEGDVLIPNGNLFREREYLFSKIIQTKRNIDNSYSEVRDVLPKMVEEVRSIHAFHISDLSTYLQPGVTDQTEFENSSVVTNDQQGEEILSIELTAGISGSLLDIIALFYELQSGTDTKRVQDDFAKRIDSFNEQVKNFDDYTLDSQDSALAEALLIAGKLFTTAFNDVLNNSAKYKLLNRKLNSNREEIAGSFSTLISDMEKSNELINVFVSILQACSLLLSFVLFVSLSRYALNLSDNFSNLIHEAEKTRNDLQYRIPIQPGMYQEFQSIAENLNALSSTAQEKVKSLEKMQGDLTRRVHERTTELVHMNNRLKDEIVNKKKADESKRELEEKLIRAKKMEAIGTLAGGVAHDLNNILSGVVSYPELLLLDLEKENPLYAPLNTIKQSGEKAALIVQDLLTLARRGVTADEIVDFRALIGEYLDSPEHLALVRDHDDVDVRWTVGEKPHLVKGSKVHLLKSIMNLVANSMDAMVDGGVLQITLNNVYVDTELAGYDNVQEGEYVSITVSDTGVGMPDDVLQKIFEPFYTQKKMGRSGTGLGMAVVYNTVKDHGGYIDIKSEEGVGTAITLFFPRTLEEGNAPSIAQEFQTLLGKSEHVLVVDDIFEQRRIASSMLKRLNYTVATAAGGEEAVSYVKNNEVDCVILDMIMPPGMDGLETFMALRAIDPGINVVIASGFSENDRVEQAQQLGAGQYVRKPYSLETLGTAIKNILGS